MRYLIFILIFLVSICQSQTFITILTKSTGETLTASEFNQILGALKDSTLAIKSTQVRTGTLRLAGVNYTSIMIPSAFDDSVANYLTDAHIPNSITTSNYLLLVNVDDSSDARITYQLTQARTISGNWVSTAYPWDVNEGGSGAATFTDGGILLGSGTGAFTPLGVASNGQIPIGDGTTDPVLATITGGSSVTVANSAGAITLSAPDTLTQSWFVKDTVVTGDLPGWKAPYGITIITVSSYTDANTTTFNLEERNAATPNTAGTDVLASDQVADNNEQTTSTISNAVIDKNDWLVPTISATGDVSRLSIVVFYVKN